MNVIYLDGRVGKDPELKRLANGQAVLSFSVATNETWHDDKGQKHEKTEWHNCVAWRKLAEALHENVKKGSAIIVVGKLQTRSWEGKDGCKNYRTEIMVINAGVPFRAHSPAKSDPAEGNDRAAGFLAGPEPIGKNEDDGCDLPF
jgi:single-strand DNA-binding protein